MGIPVASGETLFVTTTGGSEPNFPAFETYLAKLDTDKNGQLSHKEFLADKEMGEHFGWLDENADEVVDAKEWQVIRTMGMGESGAIAIRAAGPAARWIRPRCWREEEPAIHRRRCTTRTSSIWRRRAASSPHSIRLRARC
jgi:hypothetical protein